MQMKMCKKEEMCNKYRQSEKAIFGRETTCGRDTDVRCRKKEISLLTREDNHLQEAHLANQLTRGSLHSVT